MPEQLRRLLLEEAAPFDEFQQFLFPIEDLQEIQILACLDPREEGPSGLFGEGDPSPFPQTFNAKHGDLK